MNIGIYIYNQAEVLDFSGPFEVFTTASRCYGLGDNEPFNTFLISETGATVTARAGYKVIPHYGIDDHPTIDVLIVVGGVHNQEMKKAAVIHWISQQAKQVSIVASVCTGAFILAQAKVIQSQRVTTHWEDISDLKRLFPMLQVVDGVRWVDAGNIITSGGISAGIDMSLHIVRRLYGEKLAKKKAEQMEFAWTQNS